MKNAILVLFMLFSCNIYCQNSVLIKDLEFKDDGKAYYKGLPFTGNAVRYNDEKIDASYNYVKGLVEGYNYCTYDEEGDKKVFNYKNDKLISYKFYDSKRNIILSSENETIKEGLVDVDLYVMFKGQKNYYLDSKEEYFSEKDTCGLVLEVCKLYRYKDGTVEKKVLSNWTFENIRLQISIDGSLDYFKDYKSPIFNKEISKSLLLNASKSNSHCYLYCEIKTDKGSKITLHTAVKMYPSKK